MSTKVNTEINYNKSHIQYRKQHKKTIAMNLKIK